MNDNPQPTRDAKTIFLVALVFFVLALVAIVCTALVHNDDSFEKQLLIATAAITLLVASAVFGLWGTIKARPEKHIIPFLNRQLAKLGFQLTFSIRRALLHLTLSAALAAATHFYFIETAYKDAVTRAGKYKSNGTFFASMPADVDADIVHLVNIHPDGKAIRLTLEKRSRNTSSKYYRRISHAHFHRLMEENVDKANLVNEETKQKIEIAFRDDLLWISLTTGTLAQFEAALGSQPLIEVNRATPAPQQRAPQILKGETAYCRGIFGFDNRMLASTSYSFALQGDKLFVRDASFGDYRWVITPTYAVCAARTQTFIGHPTPKTVSFWQSLWGRILTFAAIALALTTPFLYIRRHKKSSTPMELAP